MQDEDSDFLARIRLRPGMAVGGTDLWALHELIFHLVDNVVDLAQEGRCSQLWVALRPGNSVTITDDGPGLPTEIYEARGQPIATLLFTKAAGRYDEERNAFQSSSFGTGLSIVNALSSELHVEIRRGGSVWQQDFRAGTPTSKLTRIRGLLPDEKTGTSITLIPDDTIFESNDLRFDIIAERLQDLSFFAPSLTITLQDLRTPGGSSERVYHSEEGLLSCVTDLRGSATSVGMLIEGKSEIAVRYRDYQQEPVLTPVEWFIQYTTAATFEEAGFAIRYRLLKGQAHVLGMIDALVSHLNRILLGSNPLAGDIPKLTPHEMRVGMVFVANFSDLVPIQPVEGSCTLYYEGLREAMYVAVSDRLIEISSERPQDMVSLAEWLVQRRQT